MFCSKCGAAATGNYCCVCGQKIRTPDAENLLRLRRVSRKFTAFRGANLEWRISRAAWDLAECVVANQVGRDGYLNRAHPCGAFTRDCCPPTAADDVLMQAAEIQKCLCSLLCSGEEEV